ncbi:cell division protein FtsZ [Mycoplasma miroungirhinis]|uniref:Cell division protein FtsZ n=1 Tax=Mycoplasma miroungirhinis TaxID=754516 RepID=A0A6M4JD69_9MOLU|nr:cell division protein FtsZ [Mycoplasma miroungirhinis]QJR43996.1 cell division protein FtsZ [Mycoplasma miroungirhinis]
METSQTNTVSETIEATASIKIVGVGGAGNNSLKSLMDVQLPGVEFVAVNTDKQALKEFPNKDICLQIGDEHGRGAGADPETGKQAAIDARNDIKDRLKNTELVIIAAGMGGGTGTGASPEIAKIAKENGSLTIAVVTMPFIFEGKKRTEVALQGLETLKKEVDAYIIVSNEKLLNAFGELPIDESWKYSNITLKQLIRSIIDITVLPSYINLDFADLQNLIKKNPGELVVGIGKATGKDKAEKAVSHALKSPIIESNIMGASQCIVHISVGNNATLKDISDVSQFMNKIMNKEVDMIFGYNKMESENKEQDDSLVVTIIAAGIKEQFKQDTNTIRNEVNKQMEKSLVSSPKETIENNDIEDITLENENNSKSNGFFDFFK